MSEEKIDVLAVMDAAAQWRGDFMGDFTSAAELKASRAAVAELIDAVVQVKARLDARKAKAFAERGGWKWNSREDEDDYKRLSAALARCDVAANAC